MWAGKIAIIMLIFSFATTFGMYYINQIYNNPTISSNWSETSIKSFINSTSTISNLNGGKSPNPALVFGDFLIGLTVIFNLLGMLTLAGFTGGGLAAVLTGMPFFSTPMIYLTQIIYGVSSALLWIYIVSFRSV